MVQMAVKAFTGISAWNARGWRVPVRSEGSAPPRPPIVLVRKAQRYVRLRALVWRYERLTGSQDLEVLLRG